MTDQLMKDFVAKHGLLVIAQFYLYLIREPSMRYADDCTIMGNYQKILPRLHLGRPIA